nr:MAG TPA: Thymidylate synthase complementing protein [Caudoviricetes sp.]
MSDITLIDPKVELFSEENVTPEQHIARCARVCYGGEDKPHTKEQDEKLVEGLIKKGHLSMLRHASKYFSLGDVTFNDIRVLNAISYNTIAPYKEGILSTNLQEIAHGKTRKILYDYRSYLDISQKDMLNYVSTGAPEVINAYRLTFCITTQIATSRELNRKSPNNIAERSTRYCSSKGGLSICKPWWWDNESTTEGMRNDYLVAMSNASQAYNKMLDKGFKPEDARGLLPLDTATKVVYTYTIGEWKDILDLRLYDKTGKAHPNCKVIMTMVRDQINKFIKDLGIDYTV